MITDNKYLILRRIVQLGIMILFIGSNIWGWKVLAGNLSMAKVLDIFYLADPYAALQMLFTLSALSIDVTIGALIILILYSLIIGRGFCSWVCPVNIITDSAHWLKIKLDLKGLKTPGVKLNRKFRNYIFALSLLVSLIIGIPAFEAISPISIFHRNFIYGFGLGLLFILCIFLFDLLILKHGWCGYICPLGAFYSMISKKSALRISHRISNCTNCNDCKIVCPEVQVLKNINKKDGVIDYGACTNCGRCIDVCSEGALHYSLFKSWKKNEK